MLHSSIVGVSIGNQFAPLLTHVNKDEIGHESDPAGSHNPHDHCYLEF